MSHPVTPLTPAQIERFVVDGFVRIDDDFPSAVAAACREMLWRATGLAEDRPSTWPQPVIRIGHIHHPRFVEAANTPALVAPYDALVGHGRWARLGSVGMFPIRFPSPDDPGDCG